MPKQNNTFDAVLKRLSDATKRSMTAAREASHMALQHFHDHQDTSYIRRLHDAMPKNFLRREAFLKWARDHSPLTKNEEGEFVKDKTANANPWALEEAFKTDFWEYSPNVEQTMFTETDVVKSLQNKIKTFKNDKKSAPKDDAARQKLKEAEEAVNRLAGNSNVAYEAAS